MVEAILAVAEEKNLFVGNKGIDYRTVTEEHNSDNNLKTVSSRGKMQPS
jgi:hypothetical protein